MFKLSNLFATFLAMFFSFSIWGQIRVSGRVIDIETQKPIPFATIMNLNSQNGLYTTEKGNFEIFINKSDSIQISCIGYKSIIISDNFNDDSSYTFFLIPQAKELPEVIVSLINWADYKDRKIGYSGIKSNWHTGGGTGLEYAVYIPNEKKMNNAYIYELIYNIKKWHSNPVVVRLHLYTVSINGTPETELLDSNYIEILTGKMDEIVSFNVSASRIILPVKGIFVSMEWLGSYDPNTNTVLFQKAEEPELGFNDKLGTSITYEKKSNGKWEKVDLRKYHINSDTEKWAYRRNIPNASFGITVKIPK